MRCLFEGICYVFVDTCRENMLFHSINTVVGVLWVLCLVVAIQNAARCKLGVRIRPRGGITTQAHTSSSRQTKTSELVA